VDLKGLGAQTVGDLRDTFGDFSQLPSPAKFAARFGQCFSATMTAPGLAVRDDEWTEIDDIERNGYCFTDGVGVIIQEFAQAVARAIPALANRDDLQEADVPSAFQIRFKGCKGTYLLCPTSLELH
jgi:RNA-dependent RNA polymerase